jgi:hypothetical protein
MDRATFYYGALLRDTDLLNAGKFPMVGIAKLSEAVLGTPTCVAGFGLAPTAPASMSATLSAGQIYQIENLEASAWGSEGTDSHQIVKQGIALDPQTVTFTAPTTVGYSQDFLVEVQYQDLDSGSLVEPYYDSANPADPYNGPGNAGTAQNTVRQGAVAVQIKAGAAATSGSQTIPTPDAGWTGLFVVTVAYGQTTVTSGNITTYSGAPFIPVTLPLVPAGVQSGKWQFATDGGTINAMIATMSPTFAGPFLGQEIVILPGNANTGPTTLNGAPVVYGNGQAFVGGELSPSRPIAVIYDGAHWVWQGKYSPEGKLLGFRNLTGAAPGGTKTGSWTIEQILAGVALAGPYYSGANLSLSFNGATTGPGGMDTGSPPTSGDLSMYAIYNPTAQTWAALGCAGTTSNGTIYSGANMPSGYTASVLIWAGVTDGSGNIKQFNQQDRAVNTPPITINTGLNSASYAGVGSLAGAMPVVAKSFLPDCVCTTTGSTTNLYLSATAVDGPGRVVVWSDIHLDEMTAGYLIFVAPRTVYYRITQSQTWTLNSIGYTF